MNYNFDLEYSVIGILLTSKNSMKYLGSVKAEMFYNNACRELFKKAMECSLTNEEFTPYIAIEHLKSIGQAEETATNNVLKCSENVTTSYTLKSDLRLLQELYRKRELANILKAGIESNENFEVNTERLLQELYNLKQNNKNSKKVMKDMMSVSMEYLNYLSNDNNADRINTGFPLLDSMLKGMYPGQLVGLAGRPGTGKSAFSLNIALNVAKQGKTVAIFSQEMESNEIIERMIANQAYIPMDKLIDRFSGEEDKQTENKQNHKDLLYNKTTNKLNELSKLQIYIADSTQTTTVKIRTECQRLNNLGLIVIDYLGLMTPIRREQNRNLEIGQITRELKILASELQCPILLLSQLNRVKDETDKPSLNDYRDSGSIEQDITKSMMLWKTDIENNKLGLTINKNRRGATGNIELQFNGDYMLFTELGIYKEPPKKKNKVNWGEL